MPLPQVEAAAAVPTSIGRASVVSATLWRLGDGVGTETLSFAIFLLLGRLLAPDAFGIVVIAGTLIQACQVFLGGFPMGILQRAELSPEHLSAALWGNVGFSILCGLLLSAVAWPLSIVQGKPALFPVLLSLIPILPMAAVSSITVPN